MNHSDAINKFLAARSENLVTAATPWSVNTVMPTPNATSKSITITVDPVDNGYIITGFKNGNSVRRIASSENLMDEIQGVIATLKLEE